MTLGDKQKIAAVARSLIRLLRMCDDSDFVDEIVECVKDGDETPIEPQYL